MKMMKSSVEETKIPGLYTWQQKMGLFTQFISFVIFLICFILNIINKLDTAWLFLILVVLLLSMAYNNYSIFKRKYFTVCYLIGAILCLGIFGGMLLG